MFLKHVNVVYNKSLPKHMNFLFFEMSYLLQFLFSYSVFVNRINNMIKLGLNLEDDDIQEELPPLEEKTDNNEDDSKMEEVD